MDRVINDIHLTNIGDALRETMGEENHFPPEDMSDAIKYSNEVAFGNGYEEGEEFGYNTGFADGDEQGYQAGLEQGYNNGKADGIEEGKQAEYNEFWDNFGISKERAFSGCGWNKNTFKPNRDFEVNAYAFYYHNWLNTPYDLASHLENLGVKMLMGINAHLWGFDTAWFTRLPVLDFSQKGGRTQWNQTFRSANNLVTIDKIILPPEEVVLPVFNAIFLGCEKLANIEFEGVIGKSISFSPCPLTVASMKNIINCLKDYMGGEEYTYTVTFKSSAFNALEEEGSTAEYNGTPCTWAELIGFKKWNLTKA